jgi:hypothetical protein
MKGKKGKNADGMELFTISTDPTTHEEPEESIKADETHSDYEISANNSSKER